MVLASPDRQGRPFRHSEHRLASRYFSAEASTAVLFRQGLCPHAIAGGVGFRPVTDKLNVAAIGAHIGRALQAFAGL